MNTIRSQSLSVRHIRGLNLLVVVSMLLFSSAPLAVVAAPPPKPLAAAPYDCTSANQTDIPQAECEALVALYNATGGDSWTINTGWLVSTTPCSWYGVSCSSGHVSTISLSSNLLIGTIPVELGSLPNLTALDLSSNQLSGSIPSQLGNLTNLWYLYLNGNQLSGSIPPEIGNLINLTGLYLGTNQLSGSIPPEMGNLINLTGLSLSTNQLSGSIPPDLQDLTNLTTLYLSDNQFSGSIPPELGDLTNLTTLYLSNNQLSGSIPPELDLLTNLTFLVLSSNQLSGIIPPELVSLTALTYLRLSYNVLSTADPTTIAFLDSKAPGWAGTQTVPPTSPAAVQVDADSVSVTWTPISYTADSGYYAIYKATVSGGPYTQEGVTTDKTATSYQVDSLTTGTPYYFVVRSFTPAHLADGQQNDLTSAASAEVSLTLQELDFIGQVKDSLGNPVAGVTILFGGGIQAVSDASGNYSIGGLAPGVYTLTPSKPDYTITPSSVQLTLADQTITQNFTADSGPVTLIYPGNGARLINRNTLFQWLAVPRARSYLLKFSSDGINFKIKCAPSVPNCRINLPKYQIIYWKVEALGTRKVSLGSSAVYMFYSPYTPSFQASLLPAKNSKQTIYTTFTWKPGLPARAVDTYVLEISDWGTITLPGNVTSFVMMEDDPEYEYEPLEQGKVYKWRIKACNDIDQCSWGKARQFYTWPGVPTLVTPEDEETDLGLRPEFTWDSDPNSLRFQLQIATNANFSKATTYTVRGNSFTPAKNLAADKTYYWRVRARHVKGFYGAWSDGISFTTGIP